jgi:hypothetical protein
LDEGLVTIKIDNYPNLPDRQHFGAAAIRLMASPDTKPMAPVINGMGRVESRLKDYASGHFARQVVVGCTCRFARIVGIIKVFFTKGIGGIGTNTGGACCGLKLARTLPFGATGKPKHEPVVWIVLLGEVSRKEERYIGLGV